MHFSFRNIVGRVKKALARPASSAVAQAANSFNNAKQHKHEKTSLAVFTFVVREAFALVVKDRENRERRFWYEGKDKTVSAVFFATLSNGARRQMVIRYCSECKMVIEAKLF